MTKDSEFCSDCGAKTPDVIDESECFCPQCGTKLPTDSAFCTECGSQVPFFEEERFCTECGQKLNDDSDFCFACGAKAIEVDTEDIEDNVSQENDVEDVSSNDVETSNTTAVDDANILSGDLALVDELQISIVDDFPEEYVTSTTDEVPKWEPHEVNQDHDYELPITESETKEIAKQRKLVTGLFGITVVLLAVVIGLVIFISTNRNADGGGWRGSSRQQEYDPTADMTREEYHIHRVMTGSLSNHPNIQIGAALERFFIGIPVWSHFTDDVDDFVSVHADAIVDGETPMVQFLFRFSENSTVFAPAYLILDGAFQDIVLLFELLDEIMENAR